MGGEAQALYKEEEYHAETTANCLCCPLGLHTQTSWTNPLASSKLSRLENLIHLPRFAPYDTNTAARDTRASRLECFLSLKKTKWTGYTLGSSMTGWTLLYLHCCWESSPKSSPDFRITPRKFCRFSRSLLRRFITSNSWRSRQSLEHVHLRETSWAPVEWMDLLEHLGGTTIRSRKPIRTITLPSVSSESLTKCSE